MTVRSVVPVLTVPDLREAIARYVDVFGLRVVERSATGVTLGDGLAHAPRLVLAAQTVPPSAPDLLLEDSDVALAHRGAVAAGFAIVQPLAPATGGRATFRYRDESGRVVEVTGRSRS